MINSFVNFIWLGVAFGFAGFLIETVNYLLRKRKFVYAGDKYFWGIPILPVYAVGGLLMHTIMIYLDRLYWPFIILLSWVAVCLWEYISGYYCDKIVKRKFWDYSKERLHLNGYIGVRSSAWWLVFVTTYYLFLFNRVNDWLF